MPNDTLNIVGASVPLTAERMRLGAVQSSRLREGMMKVRLWLEYRQKRGTRPSAKGCLVGQKAESKGKSERRVSNRRAYSGL